MIVEVRKVMCRHDMDDFVHLPWTLYRGVMQYVPDLESDVVDMYCHLGNEHPLNEK